MAQHREITNLRGEQGTLCISDTSAHPGSWACFVVIEDAELTTIVMPGEEGIVADYTGVSYPQGFVLYGPISSITLKSGKVQMHNLTDPSRATAAQTMAG